MEGEGVWERGSWEGQYVEYGGRVKMCGGGEDGGRVREACVY